MDVEVREATPTDAPAIQSLIADPVDAERLVRDRRVIVAEGSSGIEGVLAYESWNNAVHLSTLVGDGLIVHSLLEEPLRFAEQEGTTVEAVVPDGDKDLQSALERAGFVQVGAGPEFDGAVSTRYRYDP
ncbi:MAG: N-acetyltransferase family protein [Halodesulfurarchaeum sp.]